MAPKKKPSLRVPKPPKRKPPVQNLTANDRAMTAAHLIDTIDHNARHSFSHAKEAAIHAEKLADHLKKFPNLRRLNADVASTPAGTPIKKMAKSKKVS